jgi:hypothetical protein
VYAVGVKEAGMLVNQNFPGIIHYPHMKGKGKGGHGFRENRKGNGVRGLDGEGRGNRKGMNGEE